MSDIRRVDATTSKKKLKVKVLFLMQMVSNIDYGEVEDEDI